MTINFSYSGSPLPNSFGIYVNGNIVYTFSDTGLSNGSFVTTVTSDEIVALAQNATYDITIYDNYGTTSSWASNTMESIPINTCAAPEVCCTVCDLNKGEFFVSAMNINGVNYNLLNPPPAPFDAYMGSNLSFTGDTDRYIWPPITSDEYYAFVFDCTSNVLVMDTPALRDTQYLTIDFNCSATEAKGYMIIEDSEGNPLPVIFTLQVAEDFTKDCNGECCNIETLNGYTLESIAKYNFSGPDVGYVTLPAPGEDLIRFVFISESSVEVYSNNVLTGTYNYTYDPSSGLLYIESPPDDPDGYLQLTCNCGLFVYTVFASDVDGGYTQTNFYFQSI
jgi:hypothetical protein